jgi:hypothetical protein
MADDNNSGLPEGAVVGPELKKPNAQPNGLPEGAVVGPSIKPSSSTAIVREEEDGRR